MRGVYEAASVLKYGAEIRPKIVIENAMVEHFHLRILPQAIFFLKSMLSRRKSFTSMDTLLVTCSEVHCIGQHLPPILAKNDIEGFSSAARTFA